MNSALSFLSQLATKEILSIIDAIPDSFLLYDRGINIVWANALCRQNLEKEERAATQNDQALYEKIQAFRREQDNAIRQVFQSGKGRTFLQALELFEYPTLFTARPVFDSANEVKYVVVTGRSQAVADRFNQEYVKLENKLAETKSSAQYLSQLHMGNHIVIAESPAMRLLLKKVARIAPTDSTVTITGESGTGKEVIASLIHRNSLRANRLFIPVNCAAIPKDLIESELFGYAPGAFTGAKATGKVGLFEMADHGTLFLDEIGELPLAMQSKLLRVLESQEIMPVGSNKIKKVDVRIIAATNQDLTEKVKNKEFREDLYYRLMIIPFELKPLRERQEDILPLANYFLDFYNKKHHQTRYFTEGAKQALLENPWPGNIRELRNIVERLVIISDSNAIFAIQISNTHPRAGNAIRLTNTAAPIQWDGTYYEVMDQVERNYITQVIESCNGNISLAAEKMGVHKSMVYKKLQKFKAVDGSSAP